MAYLGGVAVGDDGRSRQLFFAQPKPSRTHGCQQVLAERLLHMLEGDAILGQFGAGQARLDRAQVQFDHVAEGWVRRRICAEQTLFLGITLHQIDQFGWTTSVSHVRQGLMIDGEVAHSRAIFGAHIGDGRPIGQGHVAQAGAEIFDKLADDALFAQHLGDAQHQVGRRGPFGQPAGQANADNFRRQHVDGLAEHDRLGLDAAHAPAEDTQTVDHGRV